MKYLIRYPKRTAIALGAVVMTAINQTLSITAASAGGLGLKAKYNCAVTW